MYTNTALPCVGGQELVIDALARQYVAQGHEVVVLSPRAKGPLRLDASSLPYTMARHPRFVSTRYWVRPYTWWLVGLHRRWKFDVVHCHGLYPPGYLAGRGRRSLPPMVLTSHGEDVYEGYHRLRDPVLRRRHIEAVAAAERIVAISRFTREGFLKLGARPERIVDIPNGVGVNAFRGDPARPASLPGDVSAGRYYLFLGRLDRRKGVDLALEAMARLGNAVDWPLVIVGDGAQRQPLESLVETLGLAGRVYFVGWAHGDDKAWLLRHAAVSLVPSRLWEAFGLVVTESYAAGRPVIASRLAGLADLVSAGQTGWVVDPESPAALAAAMGEAFSQPQALAAMAVHAAAAAERFAWSAIAARHLELYSQVASPGF